MNADTGVFSSDRAPEQTFPPARAKTDRELLELAAKSVGIVLDTAKEGERSDEYCHARIWDRTEPVRVLFYSDSRDHPMCRKPSTPGNVEWNPLTDDGDALRLANTLEIEIRRGDRHKCVYAGWSRATVYEVAYAHHADKNAATRRAIVLAAAELGLSR